MNVITKAAAVIILAVVVLAGPAAEAREGEGSDKTLSPYFFIKNDSPGTDQLPLRSTSATVSISGVIADVKVMQLYKNEGKRPIEAVYIFPASTRAAVHGMKMIIGERVIHATVKKRDEARQDYEQAKQQGKSASLLEQQRPNVFQMNVANILPGDVIRVELSYTELLVPTDRVYEFVYPTVVGPRYSNQTEETAPASEKWVQNPYLRQGDKPHYSFDISVKLSAGMAIQKISSPSHKIDIRYSGTASATATLAKDEADGGSRDYVLRYQLAGEQVEPGLLLYKGEKENFFLLMLQPPKRVMTAQVPGREYIFIVDVSGSMHGFPLEISKKLLKDLIGSLRPSDRFNVMLFSGGSSVMSEHSLPATTENIKDAVRLIEKQQGGGGTELFPAMKRALSLPRSEGVSRTIVIATDGYVMVEEDVFDLMRKNLGNANMFAFGIGTSVNRHIIEGMAHVGMGEPFVITKPEDAPGKAEAFRKMIQYPVLTQVKADFQGFHAYDVEPLSIPDVLAERPVILFGKWRGRPQGKIVVKGISGEGLFSETIGVEKTSLSGDTAAIRYLWARHRAAVLSDYNMLRSDDSRIREITDLGLQYNLLTKYTSFVAVDSEIRNKNGDSATIKQPLPLPDGVSDYAVGGVWRNAAPASMPLFAMPKKEIAASLERKDRDEEGPADRRARISTVTVSAGLTEDAVRKELQNRLQQLSLCHKEGDAPGSMRIKLTINPDGTVKDVDIPGKSKTGNFRPCLMRELKKIRFTEARGSSAISVVVEITI